MQECSVIRVWWQFISEIAVCEGWRIGNCEKRWGRVTVRSTEGHGGQSIAGFGEGRIRGEQISSIWAGGESDALSHQKSWRKPWNDCYSLSWYWAYQASYLTTYLNFVLPDYYHGYWYHVLGFRFILAGRSWNGGSEIYNYDCEIGSATATATATFSLNIHENVVPIYSVCDTIKCQCEN